MEQRKENNARRAQCVSALVQHHCRHILRCLQASRQASKQAGKIWCLASRSEVARSTLRGMHACRQETRASARHLKVVEQLPSVGIPQHDALVAATRCKDASAGTVHHSPHGSLVGEHACPRSNSQPDTRTQITTTYWRERNNTKHGAAI